MTQPLALVLYERLLPGSQIVNKLVDLKYRVQPLSDPSKLQSVAEQEKPMLVIADFHSHPDRIATGVAKMRQMTSTVHIPVIGFGAGDEEKSQEAARNAGVTLLVSEAALLNHLSECLEQALRVE